MTLSWQDAAVISSFIQGDISVNVYIENVVDRFSAPPDSVENYSLSSDYKNNEDYQRLAVLLPRLSIANRNTVLTALGYPGMRFMPVFREMYTALTNDELVAFYQENRTTLIENMTTVDDCLALTDMFSHLDEIDLLPVMSATLKVRLGDKRIFKDLIFNLLAIKNGDRVLALIGYPLFETTTQMSRCYRLVQQWGEQSHVTATEYFALIKEELYRRVFAGTIKDFFNGLWITYEENNSQEYTLANRRKFLLWGNTEEALSQLCSTLEFPGKNELLRKYGNLPKRITLPIIVEQLFSDLDKMEDPASEESIALVNSIYSAVDSETLVSVLLNRCFDFDKMRRDFNGCTEDNQAKLVSWLFEGEKRGLVTIRSCYDMAKTEKVRMMFRDEIIQSSNNAGVAFDRLQELGFKKEYFISYLQDNLFRDRDHHSRSGTSPLEELITKLSLEHRRYYQDILLPRINELYGLKTQIEKIVEYLQQSVGENTLDDKKFAEHVAQVSWYLREGPVEANLFFQFIMALFLNDNQKRIASSACERVLEDLKNQSDPTVTKVLIENELFRYVKFRVASAASREAIWKIAQDIKKIGNIVDLGKHIMFDIEDFLYDGLMRDKLRMPLLDAIEHLFPLFIYRCRYNDRRFFAGKLLAVLNAENWQKIFEIVDINAYLYDKFIPGMLLKRSDLCQIFPTEEAIKMFLSKHAANYSGCGMGDLRAQFMKKWVETFQKEYARQSGNSSISFFEDPYLWWRGKDMTAQDILKYAQENPRSNIAKVISPSRSSVMKGKQSVAA